MNLRDKQKLNRHNKLIEAARSLFADGKYFTCTIDDISSAAGCSRTLYYKHFKDKEDILDAVIGSQYAWWRSHIESLGDKYKFDKPGVIEWLEEFIRRFSNNGEIMQFLSMKGTISTRIKKEHYDRLMAISILERNLDNNKLAKFNRYERHRKLVQFVLLAETTCMNMAFADFGEEQDPILDDIAEDFLKLINR